MDYWIGAVGHGCKVGLFEVAVMSGLQLIQVQVMYHSDPYDINNS